MLYIIFCTAYVVRRQIGILSRAVFQVSDCPELKHYRLKSVGFGAKAPIIATESRCQSKDLFARLQVCLSSTQVAVIPLP